MEFFFLDLKCVKIEIKLKTNYGNSIELLFNGVKF